MLLILASLVFAVTSPCYPVPSLRTESETSEDDNVPQCPNLERRKDSWASVSESRRGRADSSLEEDSVGDRRSRPTIPFSTVGRPSVYVTPLGS